MPRLKGSSNKNRDRLLRQIQQEFPDYNGLLELLKIAGDSETTTAEKISCHTTVCRYIYPQLKAVEHSGSLDNEITYKPIVKRFDGSVDADGKGFQTCLD